MADAAPASPPEPRSGSSPEGSRRRQLGYWSVAVGVALAAPLAGHLVIESAVDSHLVPALERATGESVELGGVEVSLLGSVALTNLALGDFIRADRVEGRVALGSMLAGRLSADEIEIRNPRIDLRQGGRRLRRLVTRLHRRRAATAPAPTTAAIEASRPRPRWPHLRVSGGELRVRTDRGSIAVRGLHARPLGDGLRLVTGPIDVAGRARGRELELAFARAAADVDTGSGRLGRAVALGGRGHWGPIDIDGASAVRAGGVDRVRAQIRGGQVTAEVDGAGVRISLDAVPASAVAPLAGSLALSGGAISGTVAVAGDRLAADLRLDGVTGRLAWLAPDPVDLSSRIEARVGLVRGSEPSIDIESLAIHRGALVARLSGVVVAPGARDRASGQLRLAIDEARCGDIVASLPPQLSTALRGVRVDGTIAATVDARFDLSRPVTEALSLAVDLDPSRCDVRGEPPRFTDGLAASAPVSIRALPRHVSAAFVVAEDSRFFEHRGFDRRQIELSLAENLQSGEVRRGGSTITQQLAKNLFLDTRRTLARKLQEAVLAWRLEATHSKPELLGHYLGIIQLGVSVRGVEAAAQHWFGKRAARLSPREAAFLACLTRAPTTLERAIRADGGLGPELARRVDEMLASLRFAGAISMASYRRAMAEELALAPSAVAVR